MDEYQQLGEVKTRNIHGNDYLIRVSSTLEDDTEKEMFDDLYSEMMNVSATAKKRAKIYKIVHLISNLLVIIAGGMVGLMGLLGVHILSIESTPLFGVISFIGFTIMLVKVLEWAIGYKKKSIRAKDTYYRVKEILREIREIHDSSISPDEKVKKYEKYWTELDQIDLNIFGKRLVVEEKKKISYEL